MDKLGSLSEKIIVLSLLGALASGCTQANGSSLGTLAGVSQEQASYLSPEERALRKKHNTRRVISEAAKACVTGAVVGAAATLLLGASSRSIVQNAAIACALGAAVGAARGAYVNARLKKVSNSQAYYSSLIKGADLDIARYESLNNDTSNLIRSEKTKIRSLNKKLKSGEVSKTEYRKKLASSKLNMKIVKSGLKEATDNAKTMDKDISGLATKGVQNTSALKARSAKLKAERNELKGLVDQLADVYQELPADAQVEVS